MLEAAPLNRFPVAAGQRFSNGALSGGPFFKQPHAEHQQHLVISA
jgi:hypothetical protein